LKQIEQQQVRVYPVADYALFKDAHQHKIVLGYGNVAIADIESGIQRLKQALIETQ
jgi:DNA-binding transcriptional MocR family regulator